MNGTTPVEGADIRVIDNGYVVYASSGYGGSDPHTDSARLCSGILVTDRVCHHLSSTATENTTLVSAKHGAWEETDRDVDMSESHTEEFSTRPGTGTTGGCGVGWCSAIAICKPGTAGYDTRRSNNTPKAATHQTFIGMSQHTNS